MIAATPAAHEPARTGRAAARAMALALAFACLVLLGGCRAGDDRIQMDAMKSKSSRDAAREFVPEVEAFIDSLPIRREKFQVRANRCAGTEGEQRDDIFHIWVGLQGIAPGNDIAAVLESVHERWQQAGWTITRHRQLANGGVNVAATDPATGNAYSLDSGFDKGPDAYVVGFFNTPCFQDPSGDVDFGDIDQPATLIR